ncbi:MAG: hypothetical protein DRQ02_04580 [Candidatus Latescibacterota bacterium]|nr:MAG: hypothetical protein DRQ02_04580 [Candidatus Latescibacterota bacterium]RKY73015.1 MAG: hypothetical protein DRQ24_03560 [Candidatus Latescibacterota bacterium]
MASLQISVSVRGFSRARFHRRLETPPTIRLQGTTEHGFCEIAIFQKNPPKRQKNFQRSFSRIWV